MEAIDRLTSVFLNLLKQAFSPGRRAFKACPILNRWSVNLGDLFYPSPALPVNGEGAKSPHVGLLPRWRGRPGGDQEHARGFKTEQFEYRTSLSSLLRRMCANP